MFFNNIDPGDDASIFSFSQEDGTPLVEDSKGSSSFSAVSIFDELSEIPQVRAFHSIANSITFQRETDCELSPNLACTLGSRSSGLALSENEISLSAFSCQFSDIFLGEKISLK